MPSLEELELDLSPDSTESEENKEEKKTTKKLLEEFKEKKGVDKKLLSQSFSLLFHQVRSSRLYLNMLTPAEQVLLAEFIGWRDFYFFGETARELMSTWTKHLFVVETKAMSTVFKYSFALKQLAKELGDWVQLLYPYKMLDYLAEKVATGQLRSNKGMHYLTAYRSFIRFIDSRFESLKPVLEQYGIKDQETWTKKVDEFLKFYKRVINELSMQNIYDFSKNLSEALLSDEEIAELVSYLVDVLVKHSAQAVKKMPKWVNKYVTYYRKYGYPPPKPLPHIRMVANVTAALISLATGRRLSEINTLKWKDVVMKEYDQKETPFLQVRGTTGHEYFIFTFRIEKKRGMVEHTVTTQILPNYINHALFLGLQTLKIYTVLYAKTLKPDATDKELNEAFVFFKGSGKHPVGPWTGLPGVDVVRRVAYKVIRQFYIIKNKDPKSFKFHYLRHQFISALVNKTDVIFTARFVNVTPKTLMHYVHKSVEEFEKVRVYTEGILDMETPKHLKEKTSKEIVIEEVEEE